MKEIIVLSLLALSLEFSFKDLQRIFHQLSIYGLWKSTTIFRTFQHFPEGALAFFHRGLFSVISSLCVFLGTLCTESHWWLFCAFCMLERITGLTATHALETEILNKPYGRSNGFASLNVFHILLVPAQGMPQGTGMCRWFVLCLMYCPGIKLAWKLYVFLFQPIISVSTQPAGFPGTPVIPGSHAVSQGLGTNAKCGWNNRNCICLWFKGYLMYLKVASFPRTFWYNLAATELGIFSRNYRGWADIESAKHTFIWCLS